MYPSFENGIVLPLAEKNLYRILEKSSSFAYDLQTENFDDEEIAGDVIKALDSRIIDSVKIVKTPQKRISIVLEDAALKCANIDNFLLKICNAFKNAKISMQIHNDTGVVNLTACRLLAEGIRNFVQNPKRIGISLISPFEDYDGSELEPCFNVGVRFLFVAGWRNSQGPRSNFIPNLKVLREFSEFGVRTVLQWYIHSENVQMVETYLSDLLQANMNSGFSLPLACQSPFYHFDRSSAPELPSADAYNELLINCYEKYPHYDDVFAPLNSIMLLVQEGGWDYESDTPSQFGIRIGSEGNLSIFRHYSGFASYWTDLKQCREIEEEDFRKEILEALKSNNRVDNHNYCGKCAWRYTCGGIEDLLKEKKESVKSMICETRMLFLRHFARMKQPIEVVRR